MLLNREKWANCKLFSEIKEGFANNYRIDKMHHIVVNRNYGGETSGMAKMSTTNRHYKTSLKRLYKISDNS